MQVKKTGSNVPADPAGTSACALAVGRLRGGRAGTAGPERLAGAVCNGPVQANSAERGRWQVVHTTAILEAVVMLLGRGGFHEPLQWSWR